MEYFIREILKPLRFNLKERIKVYTWTTAGALLPLILMRYGFVPNQEAYSDIETEAGKWLIAAVYSLIPSTIGAFLGRGFGIFQARVSRFKINKKEKQSQLENQVKREEK